MKIDTTTLKEKLSPDDIIKLVIELGSTNYIDERSKGHIIFETICHNDHSGSMKLYYYVESRSFFCYTGCACQYDIFSLFEKVYKNRGIDLHFSSVVEMVAQKTGNMIVPGFGQGFMQKQREIIDDWQWINKVTKKRKIEVPEPQTYSDKMLDAFSTWYHPLFLDDHITVETMKKFNIRFSETERRIVIPHYYYKDPTRIIGMRGRTIDQSEVDAGRKYFPISLQNKMYNFSTFQSLFGLAENQEVIKRLKKVAIFESEKSVMQAHSYYGDSNFTVALSGKNISQHQVEMLLDLGIEEVALCFDKMYSKVHDTDKEFEKYQEFVTERAMKFAPFVRTFVVYDKQGLLNKNDSPSDRGIQTLNSLMHTKTEIKTMS